MEAHAELVKECTRLLVKDKAWIDAIEEDKHLAGVFKLDRLIQSSDSIVRKVGVNMGAVLMSRVSCLELADIVEEDHSMEKIGQALLKFVLNQHLKLRQHYDD
jgi:hypothetical protein